MIRLSQDRDFLSPGRSLAYADGAMCATSHPIGVRIALETMRGGGNAVDAAVAAAVALGFAEPGMTGLAGDLFAVVWEPGATGPVGLNASGRAPQGVSAAALRAQGAATMALDSPHSVTIPGAVSGFDWLVGRFGRRSLGAALAPAIEAAERGVPVAPRAAHDYAKSAHRLQGDARRHFLIDDRAPRAGETMRYPAQAKALRLIAEQGIGAYYEGEIAADMVDSLAALGGTHTMADFAAGASAAHEVAPISTRYRGYDLIELPPNGHGATAILMANILAGFDLAALDPAGAQRIHLEAEAAKRAYAARDRLVADPDAPGAEARLAELTSPETAARLRAQIDPRRASGLDAAPLGAPHKDTIYICVVDQDRLAVSLIYSVFHAFGSGLASSKFGIGFQNRGAGFVLEDGHPNELRPGRRPLHTIIPGMFAKDGALIGPFGVMGGRYQPTGHVRLMSNLLDFGMDPQTAIDAPRAHQEPTALTLEAGVAEGTAAALADMGHVVARTRDPIGGAQIILNNPETGGLVGASDPRKDGMALGF